jgi:threonine/homoserine/homoserine lactone efflux protein
VIEFEVIVTFSVLIFSLCFIPAPDVTQVIIQSTLQGRASGVLMVLGICSAMVLNSVAVILGMAAIIQRSELTFFVMQWAGVVYLLFLGVNSIFLESKREGVQSGECLSRWGLYRRGALITLLNPFGILFLSIILLPFVDEAAGNISFQMLQLCGLMILVVLLVFCSFSLVADLLLKKWLHSIHAQKYLCFLSGGIILFFAGYLAMAQPTL